MHAGAFRVENARIKLRRFTGGSPVNNDASEIAQATDTFCDVLAAQHFEDGIDAFAVSQLFDGFLIVALFVVDAVLQPEFAHPRQLFFRRRCSVHFDAENFANLYRGRPNASRNGVDQDAWRGLGLRWFEQTRLPVSEVSGVQLSGIGQTRLRWATVFSAKAAHCV